MGYVLRCVGGVLKGEVIPVSETSPMTMGRDEDNTVQVKDRKLSRIHCQIAVRDGKLTISDLSSTNGTLVNGERIEERVLAQDDEIQLGLARFQVIHEVEEKPEEAICAECGESIPASDLVSGGARKAGKRAYCVRCRASFGPRRSSGPGTKTVETMPTVELNPGDAFGALEITSKIGDGFYGTFYRAHQADLDRSVLLLVMNVGHREWFAGIEKEVQKAGRIVHPNVLLVYDVGLCDDVPYIAWEYTSGKSLAAYKAESGSTAVAKAMGVIGEVARALEAAFEQKLNHGLLCPAHVLINKDNQVKVLGFGLGAMPPPVGWPERFPPPALPYQPPERFTDGDGDGVEFATDVYSLGGIFSYLLTGRAPFEGGDYGEVRDKILDVDNWRPTEKRLPQVRGAVCRFIGRCTASKAAVRYATPEVLLAELAQIKPTH